MNADAAAGCPANLPSGECGTNMSTCHYIDAAGCPQRFICFSQFSGLQPGNWTSTIPEAGGPCTTTGQVCGYTEVIGDNLPMHTDLECTASGTWQVKSPCPSMRPAEGDPCTNWNTSCSYGGDCQAICVGPTGGWHIQGCP
jgi:hypothetical protein